MIFIHTPEANILHDICCGYFETLTQTVSHFLNYSGTAKYGLTRHSVLLENIY